MKKTICMLAFITCLIAPVPASADDTGFAYAHDIVKVRGKLCFASHSHGGSGQGKTKPAALAAAHQDWYAYTAGEYGSDWAHWGKSAARKVNYTKADGGWSATIESRPCK